MSSKKELCVMCAWRATCRKQFSMKAGRRCADFSRDLAIKDEEVEAAAGGQ